MSNLRLKWRAAPAPTGRYRSFETRGWPEAEYANGDPAVMLRSEAAYSQKATGIVIEIYVADYRGGSFKWRRLVGRASSLAQAKQMAETSIQQHPEIMPGSLAKDKRARLHRALDRVMDAVRPASGSGVCTRCGKPGAVGCTHASCGGLFAKPGSKAKIPAWALEYKGPRDPRLEGMHGLPSQTGGKDAAPFETRYKGFRLRYLSGSQHGPVHVVDGDGKTVFKGKNLDAAKKWCDAHAY